MTTKINDDFLRSWDGKVNPADFTYSFLGGQFRASPEFLEDLEAYYDISPNDLLSYVRKSLTEAGYKGEVDIRLTFVRSFRSKKESIWELRLVEAKTQTDIVAKIYFSSLPIKLAKIESSS